MSTVIVDTFKIAASGAQPHVEANLGGKADPNTIPAVQEAAKCELEPSPQMVQYARGMQRIFGFIAAGSAAADASKLKETVHELKEVAIAIDGDIEASRRRRSGHSDAMTMAGVNLTRYTTETERLLQAVMTERAPQVPGDKVTAVEAVAPDPRRTLADTQLPAADCNLAAAGDSSWSLQATRSGPPGVAPPDADSMHTSASNAVCIAADGGPVVSLLGITSAAAASADTADTAAAAYAAGLTPPVRPGQYERLDTVRVNALASAALCQAPPSINAQGSMLPTADLDEVAISAEVDAVVDELLAEAQALLESVADADEDSEADVGEENTDVPTSPAEQTIDAPAGPAEDDTTDRRCLAVAEQDTGDAGAGTPAPSEEVAISAEVDAVVDELLNEAQALLESVADADEDSEADVGEQDTDVQTSPAEQTIDAPAGPAEDDTTDRRCLAVAEQDTGDAGAGTPAPSEEEYQESGNEEGEEVVPSHPPADGAAGNTVFPNVEMMRYRRPDAVNFDASESARQPATSKKSKRFQRKAHRRMHEL